MILPDLCFLHHFSWDNHHLVEITKQANSKNYLPSKYTFFQSGWYRCEHKISLIQLQHLHANHTFKKVINYCDQQFNDNFSCLRLMINAHCFVHWPRSWRGTNICNDCSSVRSSSTFCCWILTSFVVGQDIYIRKTFLTFRTKKAHQQFWGENSPLEPLTLSSDVWKVCLNAFLNMSLHSLLFTVSDFK